MVLMVPGVAQARPAKTGPPQWMIEKAKKLGTDPKLWGSLEYGPLKYAYGCVYSEPCTNLKKIKRARRIARIQARNESTFWETMRCGTAFGAAAVGNLFIVYKIKKAKGLYSLAKKLVRGSTESKYKLLAGFFADALSIQAVIDEC